MATTCDFNLGLGLLIYLHRCFSMYCLVVTGTRGFRLNHTQTQTQIWIALLAKQSGWNESGRLGDFIYICIRTYLSRYLRSSFYLSCAPTYLDLMTSNSTSPPPTQILPLPSLLGRTICKAQRTPS